MFLGADEFASEHEINGRRLVVMVDQDKADRKMLQTERDFMGVFDVALYFYAAASDFPQTPRPNDIMIFDRKQYSVRSCYENQGVLEIMLIRGAG